MIASEELGRIRTLLRERMDNWQAAGEPIPTLNAVRLEMNRDRVAVDIAWRLNNGGEITLRHYVHRFFNGAHAALLEPIKREIIQMYREKFIELTGNHEAYVPDPHYQYAIIEPLSAMAVRSMAEPFAPMDLRTTRDPYHANQPDRGPRAREQEEQRRRYYQMRDQLLADPGFAQHHAPNEVRQRANEAAQQMARGVERQMFGGLGNYRQQAAAQAQEQLNWEAREAARRMMTGFGFGETTEQANDRRERVRAAEARREQVNATGWKLLRDNLNETQRAMLDAEGYFWVQGGDTGLMYRISEGKSFNINVYQKPTSRWRRAFGRLINLHCSLCFQPSGDLCTGDVMLTQKLAIELREFDALKTANYSNNESLDWLKPWPKIYLHVHRKYFGVSEANPLRQGIIGVDLARVAQEGRRLGLLFGGGVFFD